MPYLVFLNNYNIRQCEAQYLGVLYEILGNKLNAHFILNTDYLKEYKKGERWEVGWAQRNWGDINQLCEKLSPENCTVLPKPETHFDSNTNVPSQILYKVVHGKNLESNLTLVASITDILKKKEIKAGITWVNNRTFKEALAKHGIPTIHHELGPFRPSTYIPTAYLDFEGVNGGTEFNNRFNEFLKIVDNVPILTRKELIKVISPNKWQELYKVLDNEEFEYEAGVGLQVEVDTNLLLFNNGRNWIDAVLQAEAQNEGKVLVRPHPVAGYKLDPKDQRLVVDDLKEPAYEFINKCKKIYCLNSSIGVEALLLGRKSSILGESPFYQLQFMDEETLLKALNFTIFGYLIHRELLFNESYYDFRIQEKGNEEVIYKDNMKRLIKKGLKICS